MQSLGNSLKWSYVQRTLQVLVAGFWCWSALPSSVAAQEYQFKTYQSSMGLPSNAISHLYQDQKGYIWFATPKGASRYDGFGFTTLSVSEGLPHQDVRSIFEDAAGGMWFVTLGGVSRQIGQTVTTFRTEQGLSSNECYVGLCDRSGTVWIGTANGLCRFEAGKFVPLTAPELPSGRVWALCQDSQGNLWMGTRGGGLGKIEGSGSTGKVRAYGLRDGLPSEHVFGLTANPGGGVWVATLDGVCFLGEKGVTCYRVADGLSSNNTNHVVIDRYGRVWCATFGGGLCRLENGHWTVFSTANGLPNDYLTALMLDEEGNLWGGTWLNGAFRFSHEAFVNYPASSGLSAGIVSGLAEAADGTIWISSINGGLSSLSSTGKIRKYRTTDGLLEEVLWCLYQDSKGRIWTGGYQGVSVFDGKTFRRFTRQEMGAADRITSITEDAQGHMWFGTQTSNANGAVLYDGKHFSRISTEQGLVHNWISVLMRDRANHIWIGTLGGLSRFDGQGFTNFKRPEGLPSEYVLSLFEDADGTIWAGTDQGACRFDGTRFQPVPLPASVPNHEVRNILRHNGSLWFCTGRGIATTEDGTQFTLYTVKDGLMNDEFYWGACLTQRNGNLWFGTSDGIIRYRDGLDLITPKPPRLYLRSVTVQDEPAIRLTQEQGLSFAYRQNSLTFESLGMLFSDENSVLYSYRLESFDQTWSVPNQERLIRYTNLPPGQYRFWVKAKGPTGSWSAPQSVFFTIRAPFWETWWFRAVCLLGLTGSFYGGIQLRLRTLHQQNLRLEQKIAERTRQLGERNLELNRKNLELAEKNQALTASQQQADRIFSALAEALPGTVLDGKYRLDRRIGSGGFGIVFQATHLVLNHPIAVKVFKPRSGNDSPEDVERFRREGVAACRVNHPNALAVLDSGISGEGIAYLVMELLDGHSLQQELREKGRLPFGRAAKIVKGVCKALQAAHSVGIVHRDIKPDNIFLHRAPEGEIVKVVDFGIAKLFQSGEVEVANLTATGNIVGTPLYMAPERLNSDAYDGRADVYSLGVMLYEMLCGRVPFQITNTGLVGVMLKHLNEAPPPLKTFMPEVPEPIEAVVMQALVKNPDERPNAQVFAAAFAAAVAECVPAETDGQSKWGILTNPKAQPGTWIETFEHETTQVPEQTTEPLPKPKTK
ncbi:MAG: protein kinase [Blastocatellia bacterium]|nr:protein kinase [Blastocatellia bacterium]